MALVDLVNWLITPDCLL